LQKPCCTGSGSERALVNYLGSKRLQYRVHLVQALTKAWTEGGQQRFIIRDSGTSCGVGIGSLFSLYSSVRAIFDRQSPLCTLKVESTARTSCTVIVQEEGSGVEWSPSSPFPLTAVAVPIHTPLAGDLRVYIPDGPEFAVFHQAIGLASVNSSRCLWKITAVPRADQGATLHARFRGSTAVLAIVDQEISALSEDAFSAYTATRTDSIPSVDDIASVLRNAARFFFYLRALPVRRELSTCSADTRIYDLDTDLEQRLNLLSAGPGKPRETSDAPWRVDVEASASGYDLHVYNTSDRTLFPSVFFFDLSGLSIGVSFPLSPTRTHTSIQKPGRGTVMCALLNLENLFRWETGEVSTYRMGSAWTSASYAFFSHHLPTSLLDSP